jgi:hypothetical protein
MWGGRDIVMTARWRDGMVRLLLAYLYYPVLPLYHDVAGESKRKGELCRVLPFTSKDSTPLNALSWGLPSIQVYAHRIQQAVW